MTNQPHSFIYQEIMIREGVIYEAIRNKKRGEVVLGHRQRVFYPLAKATGSGLVVAGIAGIIFTFGPILAVEFGYRINKVANNHSSLQKNVSGPGRSGFAAIANLEDEKEKVRRLAQEWGVPDSTFSVYIPKILARSKILANVSPLDQKEYMRALSQGVAHATGSSFPGMPGATYLFAHSTDAPWNIRQYNAVFYLLRELDKGDEIYVFFLDKLYRYKVTQKIVTKPQDVSWLTDAHKGPQRLVLQSCWPPGTTLKRLIVVAEPSDSL